MITERTQIHLWAGVTEELLLHGLLVGTELTIDVVHGLHAVQLTLRKQLIADRMLLTAHRHVATELHTKRKHLIVRASRAELRLATSAAATATANTAATGNTTGTTGAADAGASPTGGMT